MAKKKPTQLERLDDELSLLSVSQLIWVKDAVEQWSDARLAEEIRECQNALRRFTSDLVILEAIQVQRRVSHMFQAATNILENTSRADVEPPVEDQPVLSEEPLTAASES